jgi:hypothetical protein
MASLMTSVGWDDQRKPVDSSLLALAVLDEGA